MQRLPELTARARPSPRATLYNVGVNPALPDRRLTPLDRLLEQADLALRAAVGRPHAQRPNPGATLDGHLVDETERRHVAGLLRVDHAGEVAAQGLYHGQALTARRPEIRAAMKQAAAEEGDHLAWCHDRLQELGDRPSVLNPLWYAGSLVIGAVAGAAGDRWSLGFMAETERQVEGHLDDHLARLPASDARSRAILEQMKADEVGHAEAAVAAGGSDLPLVVRRLMTLTAKVMTETAYRI
jgi:ubiquinone biosynthesis monooxygenase Coq7